MAESQGNSVAPEGKKDNMNIAIASLAMRLSSLETNVPTISKYNSTEGGEYCCEGKRSCCC